MSEQQVTPAQGSVLAAIEAGRLPGPGTRSQADEEAVTELAVPGLIRWSGHSWEITRTGEAALRAYLGSQPPADEAPPLASPAHDSSPHLHSHEGALSGPMADDPHDHLHAHQYAGVTHRHPHSHQPALITRTGKVLSDADVQALADEAERGYDVSQIAPGYAEAGALGRVLYGLPQALREHQAANPSHGYNCACLDELIRQVRNAARELHAPGPEGWGTLNRLRYVLDAALEPRWLA